MPSKFAGRFVPEEQEPARASKFAGRFEPEAPPARRPIELADYGSSGPSGEELAAMQPELDKFGSAFGKNFVENAYAGLIGPATAGAEALTMKGLDLVGAIPDQAPVGELYSQIRRQNQLDAETAAEESPAGGVIGGLTGAAALPGAGAMGSFVGRGTGLAGRAARSALVGGGVGGVTAAAQSGLDPVETAKGAGLGVATGVAFPVVARATRSAASALGRQADDLGLAPLGFSKRMLRKQGGDRALERGREVVRAARDEGVLTELAGAETMLSRAQSRTQDLGESLGNVRDTLDAAGEGVDAIALAQRIENELADWRPRTEEGKILTRLLGQIQSDVLEHASNNQTGQISATALAELKGYLRRLRELKGADAVENTTRAKRLSDDAGRVTRQAEDELVEGAAQRGVLTPDEAQGFVVNKRRYGAVDDAADALEERVLTEKGSGGRSGAASYIAGGTATTIANALDATPLVAGGSGIAATLLAKAMRSTRTPQAAGVLMGRAERVLGSRFAPLFDALARRNPQAVALLHERLMDTSPEYRALQLDPDDPTPGVEAQLSDRRAKERIRPLDSKAVLDRLEQLRSERQAPKPPSAPTTNPTPTGSSLVDQRQGLDSLAERDGPPAPRRRRVKLTVTKRDQNGDILEMEREEL